MHLIEIINKSNMKKILKSVYSLSGKVFFTVVSIISILLFSSFRCAIRLKKISKKNTLREIYILGNGPSLNGILKTNQSTFISKNLMVVNFFCFDEAFITLKPNYYVFIEPNFLLKNPHIKFNEKVPLFIDAMMKVDWNLSFFYPQGYKNSYVISRLKENKNITVISFNTTPLTGFEILNQFFYTQNLGMPIAQNISIAAIFISLQLNFKVINLFGVEHSWLSNLYINELNQVCLNDKHCYKESETLTIYEDVSLSDLLSDYSKVFNSHKCLRYYSDKIGAKIINYSNGSYIDAYERNGISCLII